MATPTRYHWLAVRLDRFVARVGINSASLRARLPTGRLARAAVYLPNGIDLPAVARLEARRRLEALCGRSFDGPIVLNVANIRVEKDTCGLFETFARFRRVWPRAHLICVGAARDSDYWQATQRTMKALVLNDCVHFAGACPDAWRLMAGADVFCLSSRTESMPNVILEAMSQRVPIVATAVGDVGCLDAGDNASSWLLRDGESGLLVLPGDPAALAAALVAVLDDPVAAEQRADRAFDHYRARFTTGQMVRRYERFYADARGIERLARSSTRSRRRRAVLMLGPALPQMGGMVTSIRLLMKSPLRERYVLHRCATPAPQRTLGNPDSPLWTIIPALVRHAGAVLRLFATLVARRIDLLHIHTCSYLSFYRSLLDLAVAKALGRAVVLHIRGGRFACFCRDAGKVGQTLIRRGLRAADAIVVVSPRWRDALRRYAGSTPIYAVPNAAETADVPDRPNLNGHPCRFLYLANLTEAKGLGDLIAAAAALRADGLLFELLIAGPAPHEPQSAWEARARHVGLAGVATFLGPVSGPTKTRLLATADCFVHPSHSEALPNAVLEAAAAGVPVIATAVGSLPEVLAIDGGPEPLCPLVPPHETAALAREMKRLATNAALRREIGAALREHVARHYSLPLVAERLGQIYDRVLAQPEAP